MKVTDDHRAELEVAIGPLDTDERRDIYRAGEFPRAELVTDLNKRYRWDLFWAAVRRGHSLPDSSYGYTDAHIDTALRSIVKPL